MPAERSMGRFLLLVLCSSTDLSYFRSEFISGNPRFWDYGDSGDY